MIDDDLDKVRRNLVFSSSLVILAWLLEVPITAALTEKVPTWQPQQLRVWLAVLAILLYLWIRYRFNYAGDAMFRDTLHQYKARVADLAMLYVDGTFRPEKSKGGCLNKTWQEICEEFRVNTVLHNPKAKGGAYSYAFDGLDFPPDRRGLSGTVEVRLRTVGTVTIAGKVASTFDVRGAARTLLKCRAAVSISMYSKYAVEYLFPPVLWIAAMLIALSKLFLALRDAI